MKKTGDGITVTGEYELMRCCWEGNEVRPEDVLRQMARLCGEGNVDVCSSLKGFEWSMWSRKTDTAEAKKDGAVN